MPKRKRDYSEERLQEKIKRYKEKLQKIKTRQPPTPTRSSPPLEDFLPNDPPGQVQEPEDLVTVTPVTIIEDEEEKLDDEILDLLGDAPQVEKFGPAIHKELASRWAGTIKNGLSKEKRTELKNKFLPPANCKIIDAPKLNLEAQAAMLDIAIKRDRAIANKQAQIGCAITAVARAFDILLSKGKENIDVINYISDAARLMCDHQYQESLTRKNFVLQGLEQSTRDAVKDTEVDEWLFGEGFAEKLKASKAIKKSGQEISAKAKKPTPAQQPKKPLNFRGPGRNILQSQINKPGPRQPYHRYQPLKKTFPHVGKSQNNKAPPQATNRN